MDDRENVTLTANILISLRTAQMALDTFGFDAASTDCAVLESAIAESVDRAALVSPPNRLSNGDGVRAVLADPLWCSAMTDSMFPL